MIALLILLLLTVPSFAAIAKADAHNQKTRLVSLQQSIQQSNNLLPGSSIFTQTLAIQVCTGLYNRPTSPYPPVYTSFSPIDEALLLLVEGVIPEKVNVASFLQQCYNDVDLAKGFILYDYTTQKNLIPLIITLAGVLDAIPIDVNSLNHHHRPPSNLPLLYNTIEQWKGYTTYDATLYMYKNHLKQTTGLAKMNPGFNTMSAKFGQKLHPELVGYADLSLVDFIVQQRLFNFYLIRGCVPGTKDYDLHSKISTDNEWAKPIGVYGYDDTISLFGGDIFEAETNCNKEHNMGQIATTGSTGLSFFNKTSTPLTQPLEVNKEAPIKYDKSKKYAAFVIGDGDNITLLKTRNLIWSLARAKRCAISKESRKDCFPLTWTISPQLYTSFPSLIQYFYKLALYTGSDYFVLPPSGDLYAYPSTMDSKDQDAFIHNTKIDMERLNVVGSVAWEWFFSWHKAIEEYFPKYSGFNSNNPSTNTITKGIGFFLTNVPFLFPIPAFHGRDYIVVGEEKDVILFKPNEWRGVDSSSHNSLSPVDMAKWLSDKKGGSVTSIYLTSDGGASIDSLYDLVDLLGDDIVVVGVKGAIGLVLQREMTMIDEEGVGFEIA